MLGAHWRNEAGELCLSLVSTSSSSELGGAWLGGLREVPAPLHQRLERHVHNHGLSALAFTLGGSEHQNTNWNVNGRLLASFSQLKFVVRSDSTLSGLPALGSTGW